MDSEVIKISYITFLYENKILKCEIISKGSMQNPYYGNLSVYSEEL